MAQLQFPREASASSYSWRLLFGGLSYWFVKGQVQTFKSGSTALAASSLFVSPHDAYFFGLPMSDYCCYPICNSLYIVSILFSIYMYILYISTLFSKTHIRSNNPEHAERMWLRLSSSHHASHGEFPKISGSPGKTALHAGELGIVWSHWCHQSGEAMPSFFGDYWINSLGKKCGAF